MTDEAVKICLTMIHLTPKMERPPGFSKTRFFRSCHVRLSTYQGRVHCERAILPILVLNCFLHHKIHNRGTSIYSSVCFNSHGVPSVQPLVQIMVNVPSEWKDNSNTSSPGTHSFIAGPYVTASRMETASTTRCRSVRLF